MNRPIGGFLPLRMPVPAQTGRSLLQSWTGLDATRWLMHNGRSALRALWNETRPRRIWLPAYICTEVATAVPADVEIRYYALDDLLHPYTEALSCALREGDHVLAVDYFGRPPRQDFVDLARARQDVRWIEDRAHALDTGVAPWGHWILYSPRKLVGVPDGGILVSAAGNLPAPRVTPPSDFSFVLPSLARFEDPAESNNEAWYARYRAQERAMEPGSLAMSRLTESLLATMDVSTDSDARRRNYEILHRRLCRWAYIAEPRVSFAPLGLPIRVPSPDALVKGLAIRRIFAARHWASLPSDARQFPNEHRLASELVTLPVDYRYDGNDMLAVADAVVELLSGT